MNDAPWRVELARAAQRDLRRLDPPIRRRVLTALETLAIDPTRAGALHKLTGAPESRLRVGDWRVLLLLSFEHRTIEVVRIRPRGRAYD